uniref:glutathione transferase n=1 Tax=Romanomermis culicivorax TaxID=13658 RepID=A0A915K820_ROMCU
MVHYKLCYFNVRGKAEGIRYIFAQAGVDFEDHRVSHDEWPKLKPNTPMGQLPVLHIDNKVLCQSMAIARYIAKEYGKFDDFRLMLCWADLLVAELLDRLTLFNKSDSILTGHKHLAQLVKHVHELPNIKKYLASRPQTAM